MCIDRCVCWDIRTGLLQSALPVDTYERFPESALRIKRYLLVKRCKVLKYSIITRFDFERGCVWSDGV